MNVLAIRKRLGWTQRRLGEELGVVHTVISKVERGGTITPQLALSIDQLIKRKRRLREMNMEGT